MATRRWARGGAVNVEYVSANPTGPMHVGHGRGAVVGDALAALLEKAGFVVCREYYINDAGAQVDMLARSLHLRYREALGESIGPDARGALSRRLSQGHGAALAERDGRKWLGAAEGEWLPALRDFAVAEMMALIRADLAALGVRHDVFTSERAIVAAGAIERALAELDAPGLIYVGTLEPPKGKLPEDWEPRPQTLFRATQFGDDVDRPLKKSDGGWTYFAADIAYHFDKYRRGFAEMIDVWGADHGGYVKRMQAAVTALTGGKGALDVKLCQLVNLFDHGEPVRMSKRAGTFVTLREVVDEVGKDVFRFVMLTRRNDQALDFDFAKVVEQSKDNPVFYVQYAHARARSVLRHAREAFRRRARADALARRAARATGRCATRSRSSAMLANWPRIVESAAETHEPHRIAFYLQDLAAAFHGLWTKGNGRCDACASSSSDAPELTRARLALVQGVAFVVASGLARVRRRAGRGDAVMSVSHSSRPIRAERARRSAASVPLAAGRRVLVMAASAGGLWVAWRVDDSVRRRAAGADHSRRRAAGEGCRRPIPAAWTCPTRTSSSSTGETPSRFAGRAAAAAARDAAAAPGARRRRTVTAAPPPATAATASTGAAACRAAAACAPRPPPSLGAACRRRPPCRPARAARPRRAAPHARRRRAAAAGGYRLQVGAVRSRGGGAAGMGAAQAGASRSAGQARHAARARADLGERGVFYRIQAGPIADAAAASACLRQAQSAQGRVHSCQAVSRCAAIFGLAGTALSAARARVLARRRSARLHPVRAQLRDAGPGARASWPSCATCVGRADAPVLIDQEGGRVARLKPPHWPAYPAAAAIAALAGARAARRRGSARGSSPTISRALGITVDCMPVLDLPAAGRRPGDRRPRLWRRARQRSPRSARAVCDGLLAGGVLPVIKHIPGHGRGGGRQPSRAAARWRPRAPSSRRTDFAPFRALAAMPWAMTAHILYAAHRCRRCRRRCRRG